MEKVLVVDDEIRHRRGLLNLIRELRTQYEVLEASNGREALELCADPSVCIVITDVKMPVLDGLDFLRSLNDRLRSLKVIILSGYAYFEYAQAALQLGAFDFVLKPVNKAKVDEMLRKAEAKIEEENRERQEKDRVLGQLDTVLPAYQERQLNKWVGNALPAAEVAELTDFLHIRGRGTVVATEIDRYPQVVRGLDAAGLYHLEEQIKAELAQSLPPQLKVLSFFRQNAPQIMLSAWMNIGEELDEAGLSAMMRQYAERVRARLGLTVLVTMGGLSQAMEKDFLVCCGRAMTALQRARQAMGRDGEHAVISKCKAYIDKHYTEDLSLEHLADQFSFNPSYFSSFFRNNTGENFTDYLLRVRMRKAVELLTGSSLKVYEIAERSGYRNEKYFNRVFKKEFGVAPDEYRRSNVVL